MSQRSVAPIPPCLPKRSPHGFRGLIAALWLAVPLATGVQAQTAEAPTAAARTPPPLRAGEHRVSLPDGGRYRGPLRQGRLHGLGRIDWDGGRRYVGQFVDGYMHGQGHLSDPAYDYVGQFQRGNLQGKGKFKRGEDYVYEGDFVQGRMEGQGKLSYGDGAASFEGQFKNDHPAGPGRMADGEGGVIEGTFDGMMPVGGVVMTTPAGDRYEGPLMGQMPHGQGTLTRADKAVVRGRFSYGSVDGTATIDYPDGAHYNGQVAEFKAQGKGELRQADGATYAGRFRDDRMDGKGTLTGADGTVQAGFWRGGRYLGATGDDTLEDTPELAARNNAALLYNQPALLQRQFDQLRPSSGSEPQLYALYVAGDGRQEVFRREVAYVDALMARRFDTRGRSVSLVNSRSSTDRLPLATPHSIGLALQALARQMNRERDLLFVFLTSHGSDTHELSLGMPRMALPGLPAARLGELLNASGIRNRVVVVSACYSGGFVPALRGDRSWVITAARADRTSFGCADDNDFTYFGRALFEQALGHAPTLSEAFSQARAQVESWEKRDGAQPAASGTEASAAPDAAASRPNARKLEHSEPMSDVAPAFQAEVDAWVRRHPPVEPPANNSDTETAADAGAGVGATSAR